MLLGLSILKVKELVRDHSVSIKEASFQAICVQRLSYFSGRLSITVISSYHKEMKMEERSYSLRYLMKSLTELFFFFQLEMCSLPTSPIIRGE